MNQFASRRGNQGDGARLRAGGSVVAIVYKNCPISVRFGPLRTKTYTAESDVRVVCDWRDRYSVSSSFRATWFSRARRTEGGGSSTRFSRYLSRLRERAAARAEGVKRASRSAVRCSIHTVPARDYHARACPRAAPRASLFLFFFLSAFVRGAPRAARRQDDSEER